MQVSDSLSPTDNRSIMDAALREKGRNLFKGKLNWRISGPEHFCNAMKPAEHHR